MGENLTFAFWMLVVIGVVAVVAAWLIAPPKRPVAPTQPQRVCRCGHGDGLHDGYEGECYGDVGDDLNDICDCEEFVAAPTPESPAVQEGGS